MTATEFEIVPNEVEVSLRLHEDVMEGVKLKSSADVSQQVVGTGKVRTGEETAGDEGLVKADAFPTDSGLHVRGCLLAQRGRKDGVEVIKDRAKRLEALGNILGGPPEDLAAHTEMMGQQNVGIDGGENPAAN